MKRILSFCVLMLCVVTLSAQTTAQESQWGKLVKIKLKTSETPIQYWAGDVDSIYFEVQDTAKYEPVEIPTVDLGLPSGLLWSTTNLLLSNGQSLFPWVKAGIDQVVNCEDYGEGWRSAVEADFQELIDNCDWEVGELDGIQGFLLTSKNNQKQILLPYISEDDEKCFYWVSLDNNKFMRVTFDEDAEEVQCTFSDELSDNARNKLLEKYPMMAIRPVKTSGSEPGPGPDDPQPQGKFKVPDIIDLGLSVKWGSFNLGAESIGEYGEYFGWGDVKDSLTVANAGGEFFSEIRFKGIAGDPEYDVVAKELGGHWRLPKPEEVQELLDYCTRLNKYDNNSGAIVCELTSQKNSKKIVLPLAGAKTLKNPVVPQDINQYCYLWTDSAANSSTAYAATINQQQIQISRAERNMFLSIRPVYDEKSDEGGNDDNPFDKTYAIVEGSDKNDRTGIIPQEGVDMGTSVKWARWNLGATAKTGANSIGRYFAWGEIDSKSTYNSTTYVSPYSGIAAGVDGFTYISAENDAATQLWGSEWSIPRGGDFTQLTNNCSIELKTIEGVTGFEFTSDITKNKIFLPAGGSMQGNQIVSLAEICAYWTSQVYNIGAIDKQRDWATSTAFWTDEEPKGTSGTERWNGLLIRPVKR